MRTKREYKHWDSDKRGMEHLGTIEVKEKDILHIMIETLSLVCVLLKVDAVKKV